MSGWTQRDDGRRLASLVLCLGLLCLLSTAGGCRSSGYLMARRLPENPLTAPLGLNSYRGPQPTVRTSSLLRRYDLESKSGTLDPGALGGLADEIQREPTLEKVYAYAELAYIHGCVAQTKGQHTVAVDNFGAAVAHAYAYLFDPLFEPHRNPYDPQFRSVCDVYNSALEAGLRMIQTNGQLLPGKLDDLNIGGEQYECSIEVRGRWRGEPIERIEFVSDYRVSGLSNRHHSYGLGVPVIAVRGQPEAPSELERYYPPQLSLPMTFFLRVEPLQHGRRRRIVLELYDPLSTQGLQIGQQWAPLQTDLSTPLAYALDCPALQERKQAATLGLRDPDKTQRLSGLFMLEPYDPYRIPVIMVHGLWSSPLTWMEMFNDLRSFPEIQQRFQFWFYLYPTGQPFWVSASQLRRDLAQAEMVLDPRQENPRLSQLVLVGHSMGGLLSRLQVMHSGDTFWRVVSDRPLDELQADEENRRKVAAAYFFEPHPSVRRVITLGTPHRGSHFSNKYTQWLGRRLITLPQMLVGTVQDLTRQNPEFFRDSELLTVNSIEALAPNSPFIEAMHQVPTAKHVAHHNVVGVVGSQDWLGRFVGHGDGVVAYESAHFEMADSEIVVTADHAEVHRHPRSILEVRRILLEHAGQFDYQMARAQPTPLRMGF